MIPWCDISHQAASVGTSFTCTVFTVFAQNSSVAQAFESVTETHHMNDHIKDQDIKNVE